MTDHDTPEGSVSFPELAEASIFPYDFNEHDIQASILASVPLLVSSARGGAQHLAASYRGFCVGAAALAYDTSPDNPRVGYYEAGNFKAKLRDEDYDPEHDVDEIPKVCAEMDIINRATENDMERIGILVVAATTQHNRIREVTHVRSATLHPCRECERAMAGSHLVDANTVLLTVGSGADIYQIQAVDEFRARYRKVRNSGEYDDPEVYRYLPYDWADKVAAYRDAVKRGRIGGGEYTRDQKRLIARRQAVIQVIKETGILSRTPAS